MFSIPEMASKAVNERMSQTCDNNCRTIFLVGSRKGGKTTLLYSFLEKTETPRETLVLEYSFGRKSSHKQAIDKTICHVWEYGGKLEILKNVFCSVPARGKFFCVIMVDLSKVKTIWNTLEVCIQAIKETYTKIENMPEIIIIGGKYDLFRNYDNEIKKLICITIRSVALLHDAHVLFYSSKEPQLVKKAKEMLHSVGFGNTIPIKERNVNFSKPLMIAKGSDNWESLGIPKSTIDQIKSRHISRIPSNVEVTPTDLSATGPQRGHAEPALDALVTIKYEELRNMESLDTVLQNYLTCLH